MSKKSKNNFKTKKNISQKRPRRRPQIYQVKTKLGKAVQAKLEDIVNQEILEQRRMPREQMNQMLAKMLPPEDVVNPDQIIEDSEYDHLMVYTKIDLTRIEMPKTIWTVTDTEDSECSDQCQMSNVTSPETTANLSLIDSPELTKEERLKEQRDRTEKVNELRKLVEKIVIATKAIQSDRSWGMAVGQQTPLTSQ